VDELAAGLRREQAVQALVPLFFASGATGLIYQTIWGRHLHLVFGTSTFAISTVLSAFMCGLALGGWWMGRRADGIERPLHVYGLLEVGIGVYALVFPFIVTAVEPIYLHVWRTWLPSPVVFGAVQFVLVGGALVIPTAAMGATLPLLARFATDRMGAAGDRIGLLYAVNTAGAVFGTWVAGFVLLPWLGLWSTTCLAAGANLLLGAAAMGVSSWASGAEAALAETDGGEVREDAAPGVAAVVGGIAGVSSLIYEVAWFRVCALLLGASVYAFSVMLLAFLIGIALGGRVGGPWADRLLERKGVAGVLLGLAWVELGVAIAAFLTMYLFRELPFWYVWLFDAMKAADASILLWITSLVLAGLVMTPAAVLMGAAFPLAARAAIGGTHDVGDAVGRVYGANTAGGVLGAALAGFVFLPTIAVRGTIAVAILGNLLAAFVAWWARPTEDRFEDSRNLGLAAGALLVAGVVIPPVWDPLMMTAGMYKYVTQFEDHSRAGIEDYAVSQYELLFYEEGLSSVVTVAKNTQTDNIWLANNGKIDASTTADMPTQVMVSLLPMQFVDDPEDVLVIGLASGITAGAVTLVDDMERLDVVELEPSLRDAAAIFAEWNHDLLEDPRTNLIMNDGRNHVLLSEPGTYDVIVSEPSNPWLTGVANLFTREFLEIGKSRLKEGGVWAQWVQLYGMDDRDVRTLLGTFTDVYPHVVMYAAAEDADLVLVGSESPLDPGWASAEALLQHERIAEELGAVELKTPEDILSTLLMRRDRIREVAGNAVRNTDDNMRIEYRAPLHLHRDTQFQNVAMLYRNAELATEMGEESPVRLRAIAEAYRFREDIDRSIDTIVHAALRLPAESPERAAWLEEGLEWFIEAHKQDDEVVEGRRRKDFEVAYLADHVQPILEGAGL
jgi:spermidine synthase